MKTNASYFTFFFLFGLFTLILSCKKNDLTTKEISVEDISLVTSKFFKTTPNTAVIVQRVIEDIKARNNKKEFIYSFATTKGFAIWDKVVMFSPIKLANHRPSNSSEITDTIVFIPIVLNGGSTVNGFIKAVINDSIRLNYSLSQFYKNYPVNSSSEISMNEFTSAMMHLDRIVFGTKSFIINDKRIFNHSNNADTANIKRIVSFKTEEDSTGRSALLATVCNSIIETSLIYNYHYVNLSPCTPTSCDRCFAYCVTVSTAQTEEISCFTSEIGGNNGTGGGSSGFPPYYPCSDPIIISSPQTGDDPPLPPCPVPDPGNPYTAFPYVDPCAKIACIKQPTEYNEKLRELYNDVLNGETRETGYVIYRDPTIIPSKLTGPYPTASIPSQVQFPISSPIFGTFHVHELGPKTLPIFSSHDILQLWQNAVSVFPNNPSQSIANVSTLFSGMMNWRGEVYIMAIDDIDAFFRFASKFDFAADEQENKPLSNYYDRIKLDKTLTRDQLEFNFLKMLKDLNCGISVIKSDKDFSSFSKIFLNKTNQKFTQPVIDKL